MRDKYGSSFPPLVFVFVSEPRVLRLKPEIWGEVSEAAGIEGTSAPAERVHNQKFISAGGQTCPLKDSGPIAFHSSNICVKYLMSVCHLVSRLPEGEYPGSRERENYKFFI